MVFTNAIAIVGTDQQRKTNTASIAESQVAAAPGLSVFRQSVADVSGAAMNQSIAR